MITCTVESSEQQFIRVLFFFICVDIKEMKKENIACNIIDLIKTPINFLYVIIILFYIIFYIILFIFFLLHYLNFYIIFSTLFSTLFFYTLFKIKSGLQF